jgi:small subunit ribosomal protein S9
VNGKTVKEYFPTVRLQNLLLDPIRAVGLENKFRISVHVHGGGPSGQASASGLGLARALVVANANHRPLLKAGKFLTRDARKVERKKPGLNKARRAPQWSKR